MIRFVKKLTPELLVILGLGFGLAAWTLGRTASPHRSVDVPLNLPNDSRTVDCGPVCIYLICKLNGTDHSLDDLRQLAKTSVLGTDMLSLKEAAAAVGFEVDACTCSFATLCEHVGQPKRYAILHSPKSHYAVAISSPTDGKMRIVDSIIGVHDLTEADLRQLYAWEGAALLLTAH